MRKEKSKNLLKTALVTLFGDALVTLFLEYRQ